MKTFYIFASVKNIYTGQVKKLQNESKVDTKVIYIEDFVEKSEEYSFEKEDVIYFLCCNSMLVPDAIRLLKQFNCIIINKKYLECNYKKGDIQNLLYSNKILVPNIKFEKDINNIKFPIFCKENRHEGIIFQAYNKITLERFFEKFEIDDYYFENVIMGNGSKDEEMKIYYVEGEVFGKNDSVQIDEELRGTCKIVSTALNDLEVFSADIIKTKDNKNYVIDVNPSAGFYLSDKGRKYFLEKIYNK